MQEVVMKELSNYQSIKLIHIKLLEILFLEVKSFSKTFSCYFVYVYVLPYYVEYSSIDCSVSVCMCVCMREREREIKRMSFVGKAIFYALLFLSV
jgi:hypothetical protein